MNLFNNEKQRAVLARVAKELASRDQESTLKEILARHQTKARAQRPPKVEPLNPII